MTDIVNNKNGISFDLDNIATDLNGKLDKDTLNINDTGKINMAGMGMPSDTYEELTLGATETTYTAPANGYFSIDKSATAAGQKFIFYSSASFGISSTSVNNNDEVRLIVPVKKGDSVKVVYTVAGSTWHFRFHYAVGSESEAS